MAKQYKKGAQTEEAFLEAARQEFASRGYLSTKVDDISRAAGRSPASFYNYFEDKAAVLTALARDFQADTQSRASVPYREGHSPQESVREAITIFWETYKDRLGVLSGVFQASMVDPTFLASWREIRGEALEFISRGVRQAQKEGYCPGVDPRLTASALSSMLEHFCYVWVAQGGETGSGKQLSSKQAIDTLTSVWVHAIYWKPEEA